MNMLLKKRSKRGLALGWVDMGDRRRCGSSARYHTALHLPQWPWLALRACFWFQGLIPLHG